MEYYSIRISILCLVDEIKIPKDGYTQDIQVHIIEANNYEEAFKKGIEIGKKEETDYSNEFGNKVKWVFKEIESITNLGSSVVGVEISSRMEGLYPDGVIKFETEFKPEKSEPNFNDENA